MEKSRSPEGIGLGGQLELASKVLRGEVVTTVIHKRKLSSYLDTAFKTGFTVTGIVGEGENFPALDPGLHIFPRERSVVFNATVREKGFIAIAIEEPKESKDPSVFWRTLKAEF